MLDQELETERRILTTFDEVREGVVEVASFAERCITILTPDLEPDIYCQDDFLEVMKRFVLAKRYARVRVLITDPSKTARNGNRLIGLSRRLNSHMDFRNLHMDYRGKINDAFIIADETAVLYRANGRRFDGIMGSNEPAIARQHLAAIENPWEASAFKDNRHDGRDEK